MKQILGLFLSTLIGYLIISFMMLDLDVTNWDWVARMFLVLFTLVTYKGYKDEILK
jgi:Ca2+/Na+ antiporter